MVRIFGWNHVACNESTDMHRRTRSVPALPFSKNAKRGRFAYRIGDAGFSLQQARRYQLQQIFAG
jgi:hypothetical protein